MSPMNGLMAVALALAASFGAWGMISLSDRADAGDRANAKSILGSAPAQLCVAVDEAALGGMRAGKTRLVLVLTEFEPPVSGRAALTVTASDGKEQVFGIFPADAFGSEEIDSHRQYLLAPLSNMEALNPSTPICVTVHLESQDDTGLARLALDTWTSDR